MHVSPALAPDGNRIAYLSEGRSYFIDLYLADLETGRVRDRLSKSAFSSELENLRYLYSSGAWSPDGQHIAMGVSNETGLDFIEERNFAFVYEVDSGEQREIGPVRRGVTSLQFSRDGRQLLISSDGGASVWDVETGENIVDLDHDGTYLNIAIWMPDGQHVVTGGRDRVVRVWDITGGTKVSEFKGHTSAINDLKLLNGGEIIVSASKDGTIRLWDTVRGGELAQLVSFGRQDRRRRDDSVARRGGEWAVIDSAGRYDASNGGDVEGLHWIVDGRVIQLSQLKERYYEPGLLAKLTSFYPCSVGIATEDRTCQIVYCCAYIGKSTTCDCANRSRQPYGPCVFAKT